MDILGFLGQNQGAQFALIASTVGPLIYRFSSQIGSFFSRLKNILFFNVTIHYSDVASKRFSIWLSENLDAVKMANYVRLESEERTTGRYYDDENEDVSKIKWRYVPAYGTFLLKPKKYPWMFLNRSKEESKKDILIPTDIFTISSFVWNKKKINQFISEIRKFSIEYRKQQKEPKLYICSPPFDEFEPSKLESTGRYELLSDELKEVYDDVKYFFSDEAKKDCHERGIKHKKGYLLYGEPGTGKSEFIAFLATSLNKDVYMIGPSEINKFHYMHRNIEKDSIIVFEDWDTFNVYNRDDGKEKKSDNKAENNTLGNLLNAMDGMNSYSGSVLIATTNDIDSIDKALLRKGRIDKTVKVNKLPTSLVLKHAERYYVCNDLCARHHIEMTAAELYNHLKSKTKQEFLEAFDIEQVIA